MRVAKVPAFFVAVSLITIACGQWSAPLPTAPSDPARGTTISGTARDAAGVALSSPPSRIFAPLLAALDAVTFAKPLVAASNVTVTVVGTSITATLSGTGSFVLTGVPSGNIQLHFTGSGVYATITINGVASEHIQLVVTLNGSNASIDSMNRVQQHNNAEVEGLITTISHGDRSMKVAGLEVKVRDAPIRHGSTVIGISSLAVGQRVHVKGNVVHDYIVATEVFLQNPTTPGTPVPPSPPSGGDDPRLDFSGSLTWESGTCPNVRFTVAGKRVSANSATSFRHGPCEHLQNESGTWVDVNGVRQGDGSFLAEKVEMKEIEFTGTITSGSACAPGQLVVNGKTVKTYSWTSFEKLACGGFVAGVHVEVKGTEHPNRVVKAIRLKYEGE
jgi:hypothetical protein